MADTGDPVSDTGCPLAYRGGPPADTGNPLANKRGPMADTSDSLANMEGLTSDSESPLADSGGPLVDGESLWLRRRQEALWTAKDTLWPAQIDLARCRRLFADTGDQLTDKERRDPLTDIKDP